MSIINIEELVKLIKKDKKISFDPGSPFIQSLLPYRAYDEDNQLFINESSIGMAFEIDLMTGANEDVVNQFHRIIRLLPEKADWFGQFIRYQHNKVGERLEANAQSLSRLPKIFIKKSMEYYSHAARIGFPNTMNHPLRLLDHRCFFFLNVKAGSDLKTKILECIEVREKFESEFQGNSISCHRLSSNDFVSFLREIINYNQDNIFHADTSLDEFNTINEQISDKNLEWLVTTKSIKYQSEPEPNNEVQGCITALTIHKTPTFFALWQSADNFMNIEKHAAGISCPFIFSMNFSLIPYHTSKTLVDTKIKEKKKYLNTAMERFFKSLREAYQEWEEIKKELDDDNFRLAYSNEVLILFTRDEKEADKQFAAANNAFSQNGFELTRKKYLQLPLFLCSLPFMMTEGLWDDCKKFSLIKRKTTFNLVNLLPIVGDYKGSGLGITLQSFRNQYMAFNPFSRDTTDNMNIAVAAAPGSGKSFFTQQIALDVLGRGGRVWIIDKGQSYKKFCRVYEGTYLFAKEMALSPFTFVKDIQKDAEQIRDFFAVLASPDAELTPVQRAFLNKAVIDAFEKAGNDAKVDDVVEALSVNNKEANDNRISDMMILLEPYKIKGQYGRYFNERSQLDPTANLTVLELDGLPKGLQRPILFALFVLINDQMYLTARDIPKMCIIDEAWHMLDGNNEQAEEFINTGYRTGRKFNGSFCSITQGISDYFSSTEAQAAWNNSGIKIIMRQGDGFKEALKKAEGFLSPYEERIVKQFKPVKKTGYASFLLKAGSVSSYNRFFTDPFSRITFSTDGLEFQAVERLENQGMNIEEAIEKVAYQFYGKEIDSINKATIRKIDNNNKKELTEEDAV